MTDDEQSARDSATDGGAQQQAPGGTRDVSHDVGDADDRRSNGDDESKSEDSDSASDDEEPEKGRKKGKKSGSFWRELPILIGVALVIALVIKAFVVQAFYIPSGSMENTLEIGDRILVNKIVYHTRDVQRGDVVVFSGLDSWDPEIQESEPSNPFSKAWRAIGQAFGIVPGKDYVKRVIGLPGDKVACCDSRHRITVNGHPLKETGYLYRNPSTGREDRPSKAKFSITVPPGHLWVMGDHRAVSYDSRGHVGDPGGGSIPEDRVIGRAFVIIWPLSRLGTTFPTPDTFHQSGLAASEAVATSVPLALGFAGAFPLALLRRRRYRRGRRRRWGRS